MIHLMLYQAAQCFQDHQRVVCLWATSSALHLISISIITVCSSKGRFVLGFAGKLRAKNIGTWLDKWEMAPGDSLIDKILGEGIKHAQAFIVVLSQKSVEKRWVREGLNAAVVLKRLEEQPISSTLSRGLILPPKKVAFLHHWLLLGA